MDAPRRTIARARTFRRALTPPEARLWVALRRRPGELKFRRQHPVGPFVLDFHCDAAKLAVEVDRAAHDFGGNPTRDIRRDAWLAPKGIIVLRVPAEEVRVHLDEIVETILAAAAERLCRPLHQASLGPPPPEGEETLPLPDRLDGKPRRSRAVSSPFGGGGGREAHDGGGRP